MRFRYLADPLCIACLITYGINRWLIKPLVPTGFAHDHVNDLLCIPLWVPLMLWAQRMLRLRSDDSPPRLIEILLSLVLWSWMFELWLPTTQWGRAHCVADPADVMCYAVGALCALVFWSRWYGDVRSA